MFITTFAAVHHLPYPSQTNPCLCPSHFWQAQFVSFLVGLRTYLHPGMCRTAATKSKFSQNAYKGKVYCLGTKIKQISRHKLLFNEIKCLRTLLKRNCYWWSTVDIKLVPITHKGDQEAVQITSCIQNASLIPLLSTDNVCSKANALVFPLTQWRQLHWDPELWAGRWGKRPWTILRHDSGRCLEGIRKISEIYLEQRPGRESNSVYPAYEAPLQRRPCQRVGPVTYLQYCFCVVVDNDTTWLSEMNVFRNTDRLPFS